MNNVFRSFVLGTLRAAGLPCSNSAIELLTMIASHESAGFKYVQQLNGPALGLYQMEPIGFDEVKRYLDLRRERFTKLRWVENSEFEMLNYDQRLATISARIFFLAKPESLPDGNQPEKLADYCKRYWNTPAGKATAGHYLDAYKTYG